MHLVKCLYYIYICF